MVADFCALFKFYLYNGHWTVCQKANWRREENKTKQHTCTVLARGPTAKSVPSRRRTNTVQYRACEYLA